MKKVTINGDDYIVNDDTQSLAICQDVMRFVGQVVHFKKYDLQGNLIGEYDQTVEQTDLDIIYNQRNRYDL